MALTSVAVVLQPPVAPFELGVLHEVFGIDRTADGVPAFDFAVCTERPDEPLPASGALSVTTPHGLAACDDADLVAVPSGPMPTGASPAVTAALRRAVDRGAWVLAMCTGAFTLAESGALDGRVAATHWRYAASLRDTYPAVGVDPDSLYRFEGRVITSAGTAAGIDACLQLVRQEHGPAVANRIARRMVVPPHRDGGQLQYIEVPFHGDDGADSLQPLLAWVEEHLAEGHTVASLAARAHLSPRTLTRRFRAEVGTSPMTWLTHRRVARAQELLESTALSVEELARAVGFGSDALLRHHFRQLVGISPSAYRGQFRRV
ncbi:GlxA family transcriptional regulator [Nocardioides sp. GCM10027113]|uniref:GlxA family transcriptional regulator n=1 Tax=unclassified Nocardioides TaxID=2615069 RepID=UPI00361D6DE5